MEEILPSIRKTVAEVHRRELPDAHRRKRLTESLVDGDGLARGLWGIR